MNKRTYSQREKRQKTYGQQSCSAQDDNRKRRKTEDPDELHCPPSPPSSRGEKTSSLLKKSLKVFGGPISVPEHDMDVDSVPKSKSRLAVFDKVLKERFQAARPKPHSIHGSREDFAETMKKGRTCKHNGTTPRTSHLPTPPADVQKTAHQEAHRTQTISKPATSAVKHAPNTQLTPLAPSQTSRVFEKPSKDSPPKQPYKPKPYQSTPQPAPRNNLFSVHVPKKSRASKLWAINQTASPFLRLPSEIRNAIYTYALGGNTINIKYETYRTTYASNAPPSSSPLSVVPIFKYHSSVFNQRATNPFNPKHQPYVRISTGFTLLNGVCRQLYHETAVLPYQLNLLAFGSHNTLFNFLVAERRLSSAQVNAITALVLPDGLPAANVLGLLAGLEKVFLGVGLQGRRKGWYYVEREEGVEPRLVEKR